MSDVMVFFSRDSEISPKLTLELLKRTAEVTSISLPNMQITVCGIGLGDDEAFIDNLAYEVVYAIVVSDDTILNTEIESFIEELFETYNRMDYNYPAYVHVQKTIEEKTFLGFKTVKGAPSLLGGIALHTQMTTEDFKRHDLATQLMK